MQSRISINNNRTNLKDITDKHDDDSEIQVAIIKTGSHHYFYARLKLSHEISRSNDVLYIYIYFMFRQVIGFLFANLNVHGTRSMTQCMWGWINIRV